MLKKMIAFASALALTPSSMCLANEAMPVAEEASPWRASLANEACTLRREFNVADAKLVFEIRQNAPGRNFEISLISDSLKRTSAKPHTQFGQSSEQKRHDYPTNLNGEGWEGFRTNVAGDYFDQPEESAGPVSFSVTKAFNSDFQIPLNLKEPLQVMKECTDTLLASWGLDPAIESSLSRKTTEPKSYAFMRPILRKLPKPPSHGFRRTFDMRLVIGENGRPIGCVLLDEYRGTEFEKFACQKSMKNARFDPALDKNGDPARSFAIVSGFVARN